MKNLLLITAIVIVNLSFAQTIDGTLNSVTAANLEEQHFTNSSLNSFASDLKSEVFILKNIKSVNNSEGKFPFYEEFKNNSFPKELKSIVATSSKTKKVIDSKSLEVTINSPLIHKILVQNYINNRLHTHNFFGDKNLEVYKNYGQLDKLQAVLLTSDNINIQLGTNILYQSINKLLKTALDKNLDNNLHLLTFNF